MKRPQERTGVKVRWQQGHSTVWHYGFLDGLEGDGSVRVWDAYSGGARSLPVGMLQIEARGPRGGKHWDWIEPRPTPTVTAVCKARPAWNPPPGPAELLNQQTLFEAQEAGS